MRVKRLEEELLTYCEHKTQKFCSLLLFTDGMDRYGANTDFSAAGGPYTGNPTSFQASGGKNGGGCARMTANAVGFTYTFPTASALTSGGTAHMCFWVKFSAFTSGTTFLALGNNIDGVGSAVATGLQVNTSGQILALKGGGGTAATSSFALSTGTYYHLELAVKWSNSTGTFKVWINGNLIINFSGATQTSASATTQWQAIRMEGTTSNISTDFDDIICWDETGTDFALTQISSSYLPEIEVKSPDGDDTVAWTKSAGATNASCVDETAFQNGDTDYNSTSTLSQEDLLTVADLGSTPTYVFGLAIKTIAKLDIAGSANLRAKLKSGATTSYSSDYALTNAYKYFDLYFGKDPDTTAVFTTSAPNAAKIGYKYQS